jgi:hypothetical protein
MESSAPSRIAASRPRPFHRARVLAVTVLAAGTTMAALAPVTAADHGPFDPDFDQPAPAR